MRYNQRIVAIRQLLWDTWNVAHIARHGVTPEEVEAACRVDAQTEDAKKGRLRITGETNNKRLISVFLDAEPEAGVYYVVTARDASKLERRAYEIWVTSKEEAA